MTITRPIRLESRRHQKREESSLLSACIEYLTLRGCFVWRQNSGAVVSEYKGKKSFVRFNGAPGCSDLIGMTPAGQFIAVETKIHPRKPTKEQEQFLADVNAHRGIGLLIYSIDELISQLRERGI